jgi:hypothetical protein
MYSIFLPEQIFVNLLYCADTKCIWNIPILYITFNQDISYTYLTAQPTIVMVVKMASTLTDAIGTENKKGNSSRAS